jgi:membrane-associated phospholipid phosphatase
VSDASPIADAPAGGSVDPTSRDGRLVSSAAADLTWPPAAPYPGTRGMVAWRLGLGAVAVTAFLVLLGLALTHLAGAGTILTRDLQVDRWFAARRTSTLNTLTVFGSGSANTQTAIAVAAVAFLLLRWWLGRWYESWVVVAAIVGELVVFLAVTAAVHRARPAVPRLDVAPPTSSFPSGHTGAAVALYGCLAYLVLRYARRRALAVVCAVVLCLVPVAVGASRLYRGMHFPTDVVAGAVGGGLWLLVVLLTLMPRHDRRPS